MNRIAELRKELDMSQQQLAEELKVHQTAVSQWETEKTMPSFELIDSMCQLFDVSFDYLLSRSDIRGHSRITDADIETLAEPAAERKLVDESQRKEVLQKAFDTLNSKGQQKAIEQVQDLAKIPDYQKDKSPLEGKLGE